MPTSAVTGTKGAKRAKKDLRTDSEREADKNAADARAAKVREPVGQPLADPSGNGTIQSVKADGSIVNYDASQEGWEDKAFEGTNKQVSRKD